MSNAGHVTLNDGPRPAGDLDGLFVRCRDHVIERIAAVEAAFEPFEHVFIQNIFPQDFYDDLRVHMLTAKHGDKVGERHQDNPEYVNKRFSLFKCKDDVVTCFRRVFSDSGVKQALLRKFYKTPSRELADALAIHHEFEYVFTAAGRFQNIHVDIPPKFMSFVFYIPEHPVMPDQEERNATILYDRNLQPQYRARFAANSVCVFVPQFASYHGFSSTVDRDALVMFYVNEEALAEWQQLRQSDKDSPPFTGLLDAIESKLRRYPLLSFDDEGRKLARERAACLVNAPQGRVLVDEDGKPLPKGFSDE